MSINFQDLNSIQKSAILLISLGVDHASKVFNNLSSEDVEKLTIAMAKLKDITSDVVNEVVKEYYNMMVAKNYVEEGGMGYASSVLEAAMGKEEAKNLLRKINASKELKDMTGGFDLLEKVDENQLINFLKNEHPQTAALIIANLDDKQAASILSQFDESLQGEITYRLAIMEKTSPELIQDIDDVLTEQLGGIFGGSLSKAGGTESVANILNSVGKKGTEKIMSFITDKNATLANEINALMFVFDDIFKLPQDTIDQIFDTAKALEELTNIDDGLAKALKPLVGDNLDKALNGFGGKGLKMLQDAIENLGPLRAKEVQEVQTIIVNMVKEMEEKGEIMIVSGDEEMI
ncbi:MAG: flagellar motor switch protein FliG [Candidatus Marinimicrobia bacterium]|nr:flagellar motor switch protein FliG [Candidatus Neomarinimicrobiota bacterium]